MNFFVSSFNRLAFDALKNYSQEQAYPITLIYGPEGVGKTELLQRFYHVHKNSKVVFMDALLFSQRYAYAAQEGNLMGFRFYLRNLSLFVLDQIENLKGKKHTLEELLHTIDAVLEHKGKVVLSFQGEPKELDFLGEKLSSRLLGGMTLPVLQPSLLEKEEFIARFARSRYLTLNDEVLSGMAEQASNLRTVQKLLNDFIRFAEDRGEALTGRCWEDFLAENQKRRKHDLNPENLINRISELTGVSSEEIQGNSRNASLVLSRKLTIYALREMLLWSYPQIGKYLGRAHSAMIKSHRQFEELMNEDAEWKRRYEALRNSF